MYASDIQCLNGADVTIQNSNIDNCTQGIYIYNSQPRILNNQIIEPTNNGIYGEATGKRPLIQDNKITKSAIVISSTTSGFGESTREINITPRPLPWKGSNNRGVAYRSLGQPQRAIQDFDEAMRLGPSNPSIASTYTNRGNAYEDLGQYQRAIQDHDEAIRLDPQNASTLA